MLWTSLIIQNEILDIIVELDLGRIANDVKMCLVYFIIVEKRL